LQKLFESFLENKEAQKLYKEACEKGDEITRKRLDRMFNEFLFDVYLTSYVQRTVSLSSKKLYMKHCTLKEREMCILNGPTQNSDVELVHTLKADVMDFDQEILLKSGLRELDDHFSDPDLIRSLRNLTERQRLIIYLAYIKEKPLRTIAAELSVPEKSVSKSKVAAITALKKCKGGSYGRAS